MVFFRSSKILHLKIRMPSDIEGCMRIMESFGKLELDALQFIDLTKDELDSKKSFSLLLKRCNKMEEKISNFFSYAEQFKMKIYKYKNYEKALNDIDNDMSIQELTYSGYFDLIENEIYETEKRVLELIESYYKIKDELIIELEKKMVFEQFFQLTGGLLNEFRLKEQQNLKANSLDYFMGTVRASDEIKMQRMILRASKGRAAATFFNFEYPPDISFEFTKTDKTLKKIFIVLFPADGRDYILNKLQQICDILAASHFTPPQNQTKQEILLNLNRTIKDKKEYLLESEGTIKKFIRIYTGTDDKPSRIDLLRLYTKKEKIIYTNLNKCIYRDNFIDGEVWILEDKKDILISLLNSGVSKDELNPLGSFIEIHESNLKKPTYIPTNDFTYIFQEIVNTYGPPRYREINPAYFNIITFPFLFGVMFGDIGHGLIIFLFSMYLFYYNKRINLRPGKSPLKFISKLRYFLLLLSINSMYCGFLYNEYMSVPMGFHNSCFQKNDTNSKETIKITNCKYPFGMDQKWFVAENGLSYFNSFKMKFSVIIGVFHMVLGIIMKGINDFYFKNYLNFIFEFFPQIIFMLLLMGYMVILIFIKWSKNYDADTSKAPSIITLLINLVIKKGDVDNLPLWGNKAKNSKNYTQENFHIFILIILVILIPIMMLPKPIIEYLNYKKYQNDKNLINQQNNINNINNDDNINENEIHISQVNNNNIDDYNKGFTDFLINQLINSIEFILGTVSNTASYLRLWALSLAHTELSKVFFEKTIKNNIKNGDYYFGLGFLSLFIGYFLLANMTLFVLIGMDFMECFLHTLRLHWVEFQNKFYYADGYLFEPYTFKNLIVLNED